MCVRVCAVTHGGRGESGCSMIVGTNISSENVGEREREREEGGFG